MATNAITIVADKAGQVPEAVKAASKKGMLTSFKEGFAASRSRQEDRFQSECGAIARSERFTPGHQAYALLFQESVEALEEFAMEHMAGTEDMLLSQAMQRLFSQYPAMYVLKAKATPAPANASTKTSESMKAVNAIAIRLVVFGPIAAGLMYGIFHWVLKLMRVA